MECRYSGNAFCASLSAEDKARLCALCHIKRYAKGQCLRESYWDNCISLVLDGMALKLEQQDTNKKPLPSSLGSAGIFFNLNEVFRTGEARGASDSRDTLCLTDCAIAVFGLAEFRALMRSRPSFTAALLQNCVMRRLPEEEAMLRSLGFGDAEESVRYILEYQRAHDIPYLTHEQIALVCNRSRQTVTTVMRQLLDKDPELFAENF